MSPFIALFVKRNGDVPWIFKWSTTHDALSRVWWDEGYSDKSWIRKKYERSEYDTNYFIRYYSAMMWIIRNPAYRVAKFFGYNQFGMLLVTYVDESDLWDSGYPNTSFLTATNIYDEKAFLFQKQIYYTETRCIEIYLGWKLFWEEPDKTCMLVCRISPFRKYLKRG